MKQITDEEYARYQKFLQDEIQGRILTPEGLRVLCDGFEREPMTVGQYMLGMLTKFENEGRLNR